MLLDLYFHHTSEALARQPHTYSASGKGPSRQAVEEDEVILAIIQQFVTEA